MKSNDPFQTIFNLTYWKSIQIIFSYLINFLYFILNLIYYKEKLKSFRLLLQKKKKHHWISKRKAMTMSLIWRWSCEKQALNSFNCFPSVWEWFYPRDWEQFLEFYFVFWWIQLFCYWLVSQCSHLLKHPLQIRSLHIGLLQGTHTPHLMPSYVQPRKNGDKQSKMINQLENKALGN